MGAAVTSTVSIGGVGFTPRQTTWLTAGNIYGDFAHFYWDRNSTNAHPGDENFEILRMSFTYDKGATWEGGIYDGFLFDLSTENVGGRDSWSNISVACNPNTGHLHVVAFCRNRSDSGQHKLYHFTDATGSWVKTKLSGTSLSGLSGIGYVSDLVFTSDGTLHMVFYGKRSDADSTAKLWYSKYVSGSWTLWDHEITVGPSYFLQSSDAILSVSPWDNDSIIIAASLYYYSWSQYLPAFIKRSSDGTWGSWTLYDDLYYMSNISNVSVGVEASTGDLYFIGKENESTQVVAFKYEYNVGWNYSFTTVLKEDLDGNCGRGAITIGQDKKVYAAYMWYDPNHNSDSVVYLQEFDGASWSTAVNLFGYLYSATGLYFIADYYNPMKAKYALIYGNWDGTYGGTNEYKNLNSYFYKAEDALWYGEAIYSICGDQNGSADLLPPFNILLDGSPVSPWNHPDIFPDQYGMAKAYRKIEIENREERDLSHIYATCYCTHGTFTLALGANGDSLADVGSYTFGTTTLIPYIAEGEIATLWAKWEVGTPPYTGMNNYEILLKEF